MTDPESMSLQEDLDNFQKEKEKIKIQLRVEEVGTTDARKNFLSTKEGIPATTICVAVRNLHSTVGIAPVKDIRDTIHLLVELLKEPSKFSV